MWRRVALLVFFLTPVANAPHAFALDPAGTTTGGVSQGATAPAAAPTAPPKPEIGPYGRLSGSLTSEYDYDRELGQGTTDPLQRRLTEILDLRWRERSTGGLQLRFSGLYARNIERPEDDRYRLAKLYGEWQDTGLRFDVRLGRQPASGNTLFSRFDGLTLGYRFLKPIGINISGGYPVAAFQRNDVKLQKDDWFYETDLVLNDLWRLWGRLFYTEEATQGVIRRRAAGLNGYWAGEFVTATSVVDYDLEFKALNNGFLGFEVNRAPLRYAAAIERRRNPFLDLRDALLNPTLISVNPAVTPWDDLWRSKTRDQIKELALDSTFNTLDYRLGVSADLSSVWSANLRYDHTIGDALTFEGNRQAQISNEYSAFVTERNGLGVSDLASVLGLYQIGTDGHSTLALTTLSKYWANGLQAGLRLRWNSVRFRVSDVTTTRLTPGAVISYTLTHGAYLAVEADYEIPLGSGPMDRRTLRTRSVISIPF